MGSRVNKKLRENKREGIKLQGWEDKMEAKVTEHIWDI